MRGIGLARGALAVMAVCAPAAGMAAGVSAPAVSAAVPAGQQKTHQHAYQHEARRAVREPFGQRAAAYAKTLEGIPYRYGGTSRSGFDCSGLTQYVYAHVGIRIPRTADDQFRRFRRIGRARARDGDLVFFHDTGNPSSFVYHVGLYEGGTFMVAASYRAGRVVRQSFRWAGSTVTFGTITR